jgi:hypothetical protein
MPEGGGSFFRVASKIEWPDWRSSGADTDKDAKLLAAARPSRKSPGRTRAIVGKGPLDHSRNKLAEDDDVEDLYRRVSLETRVVFVS